jgi:energy-converting hydrogenase A subunit M
VLDSLLVLIWARDVVSLAGRDDADVVRLRGAADMLADKRNARAHDIQRNA